MNIIKMKSITSIIILFAKGAYIHAYNAWNNNRKFAKKGFSIKQNLLFWNFEHFPYFNIFETKKCKEFLGTDIYSELRVQLP